MFAEPAFANSPEYRAFWDELARGRFQAGEVKRLGKGGKEIWLQATYNPVTGRNGKTIRVVKFATDISEKKRETADLVERLMGRKPELRFQFIQENARFAQNLDI